MMTVASLSTSTPQQSTPVEFVHLPRDVDYAATEILRRLLGPVLAEGQRTVVVDLSAVSFMDCAGLGVLLEANTAMGGRMVLLDCPQRVSELLHLTGAHDVFRVMPSGRHGA